MKFYVVIDTNVIVFALYDNDENSNPIQILNGINDKKLVPLYNEEIIEEYKDVINRKKFSFANNAVGTFINTIRSTGIEILPDKIDAEFNDKDDLVFYQVVMDKTIQSNKFLITGNIKHFPKSPIIVTPAEFMEIFNKNK